MDDLLKRLRSVVVDGIGCGERINPDGPEAADAIERLRAALLSVLPPDHGIHGGPLVGLKALYEDGTDENTARHRGWISHEAVTAARAALAG